MPTRAPRRRTGHRNWRWSYITNSERGAALARQAGYHWLDNDWHVTYGGVDWGNDHGAPLHLFFRKGDRMEHHKSEDVFARTVTINGIEYHIRTLREALEDNAHHGLSTEVEVKDWRPWSTYIILRARMAELARTALEVYGPNWRQHVNVKVLSNLGGGIPYALAVCRAAHHYGIPTILLARGRARFMRFRSHPAITWVRGSAVIRK